ncbi:hypothetical protein Ae168Ps1_6189 [Pseudonocardia sp. Ae168_Ps1]|nr:hypothetical protein Ae168Ps1_6189 [Pseudonocardia sp. Ae168_Ps1]OLL71561.1 hypothetical protein Ae263Ps1_6049 [Pseudonocardia sp. Ae263_Ps1]
MHAVLTVLRDTERNVAMMVEREPDPMWVRVFAMDCATYEAAAVSLHREQLRDVVGYLDVNTQAARGALMPALVEVFNGGQPAAPVEDWRRVLPRGREKFSSVADQTVEFDVVGGVTPGVAMVVCDIAASEPRQVGLVMSVDQTRGVRDDLRRALDWMDAVEGLGLIGVGS